MVQRVQVTKSIIVKIIMNYLLVDGLNMFMRARTLVAEGRA